MQVQRLQLQGGTADLAALEVESVEVRLTNSVVTEAVSHGIHAADATLQLTDCAVVNNDGAGITCQGDTILLLTDTTVADNGEEGIDLFAGGRLTLSGGAIERNAASGIRFDSNETHTLDDASISHNGLSGLLIVPATTIVTDCLISGNGQTGALGSGTYSRCDFVGNGADGIGGSVAHLTLEACTFIDNRSAAVDGHAVTATDCFFRGGSRGLDIDGPSEITNCAVESATSWGIATRGDNIIIRDCVVRACTVGIHCDGQTTIEGGRVEFCAGNGISVAGNDESTTIRNVLIRGNSGDGVTASSTTFIEGCVIAGNGGVGVDAYFPVELHIANSTITGNQGSRGGVDASDFTTITNSIIWGNAGFRQISDAFEPVTVTSSCVQGGYTGAGNIDLYPQFVGGPVVALGDALLDVRLMPNSPCIDAGDTVAVPAGLVEDVFGCPRIADVDGDGAAVVNIGASESGATPTAARPGDSLQAIIDRGGACGVVIVAQPGVYPEALIMNGGPVAIIAGGAPGSVIIDASTLGRAITAERGEPSVTLRGLTLRGQDRTSGRGAVVRVAEDASVMLDRCTIDPAHAPGGGAIVVNRGALAMKDTSISACVATSGAGGAIHASSAGVSVSGGLFTANAAAGSGGAIHAEHSFLRLSGVQVSGNLAGDDGGAINLTDTTVELVDCQLAFNNAAKDGGAVSLVGGPGTSEIRRSAFNENSGGNGGALAVKGEAEVDLVDIFCRGNDADLSGGALHLASGSQIRMGNLVLTANVAAGGAAIGINGGSIEATHMTAIGNMPDNDGIIVVAAGADLILANSIIGTPGVSSLLVPAGTVTVQHSNIRGGFAGTGVIDTDPLFMDADGADGILGTADDDLRLTGASPCFNTGGSITEIGPALRDDIAGEDRDLYHIFDMGAYEYRCPGDTDDDGVVTFSDLNDLLENWGATGVTRADGDTDDDGDVDFSDLNNLLELWDQSCL